MRPVGFEGSVRIAVGMRTKVLILNHPKRWVELKLSPESGRVRTSWEHACQKEFLLRAPCVCHMFSNVLHSFVQAMDMSLANGSRNPFEKFLLLLFSLPTVCFTPSVGGHR